jgi:hypothetical protein
MSMRSSLQLRKTTDLGLEDKTSENILRKPNKFGTNYVFYVFYVF